MDPLLLGTAAAFGLAASAGLNTTLPLLIVGVLGRLGLLTLATPYDALASDVALGGLALLAALEIASDKVPGWDSVVQTLQWPLAAAAGAVLFGTQSSAISEVSPGLTIVVGLLTAGAVHGVRLAVRPAVTGFTVGLGNPLISVAEDGLAVALVGLALVAPLLGLLLLFVLVGTFGWAAVWAVRGLAGLVGRRFHRGAVGTTAHP